MSIDRDTVRRVAELANLEIGPERLATLGAELGSIVDYVALLDELEVDVRPEVFGSPAPLRPDEPATDRPGVEQALKNAPDPAAGHFRVPRVLGE